MDSQERLAVLHDDEPPRLRVPAAAGPSRDVCDRGELLVGRRLVRELSELPHTEERADAAERWNVLAKHRRTLAQEVRPR
jgi:hypothetical protein